MGDENERLHAFNAWECQEANHALKPNEGAWGGLTGSFLRVEKRSEVVHGRKWWFEDLDTIHRRVHGLSPVMVSGVAPDPIASHGAAQPYHSGGEEALRHALLHILGDMPSPLENPWERCRGIAAEALGYQKPDPMDSHDPGIGGVVVTQQMRQIGAACWVRCKEMEVFNEQAAEVTYRAMHAVAPVELVPEGERLAMRERDEAIARADEWFRFWEEARDERAALHTELAHLHDKLADRTNQRDAALAKAAVPETPAHDFTRLPTRDLRRMGP